MSTNPIYFDATAKTPQNFQELCECIQTVENQLQEFETDTLLASTTGDTIHQHIQKYRPLQWGEELNTLNGLVITYRNEAGRLTEKAQRLFAEQRMSCLELRLDSLKRALPERITQATAFLDVDSRIQQFFKDFNGLQGACKKRVSMPASTCTTLQESIRTFIKDPKVPFRISKYLLPLDDFLGRLHKRTIEITLHRLHSLAVTEHFSSSEKREFMDLFSHLPGELRSDICRGIWEAAGKPQGDPDFGKNNLLTNQVRTAIVLHSHSAVAVRDHLQWLIKLTHALETKDDASLVMVSDHNAALEKEKSLVREHVAFLPQPMQDYLYRETYARSTDPKKNLDPHFGKNHLMDDPKLLRGLLFVLREEQKKRDLSETPFFIMNYAHLKGGMEASLRNTWKKTFALPQSKDAASKKQEADLHARIVMLMGKISLYTGVDPVAKNRFVNEQIQTLPQEFAKRIYGAVWERAGKPQGDPQYAEHHIHEDIDRLFSILKEMAAPQKASAS